MKELSSALVAYYYFGFKDAAKRDIRGLLTSLLLQLFDDSDYCWDLLSQLHKKCHNGLEQPSETACTVSKEYARSPRTSSNLPCYRCLRLFMMSYRFQ
jgi:hypothetical protein